MILELLLVAQTVTNPPRPFPQNDKYYPTGFELQADSPAIGSSPHRPLTLTDFYGNPWKPYPCKPGVEPPSTECWTAGAIEYIEEIEAGPPPEPPQGPTISISATQIVLGTNMSLSFSNAPGKNPLDWIALTDSAGAIVNWVYLSGSVAAPTAGLQNGSFLWAPRTIGVGYEFRMFNGLDLTGATPIATSPKFDVIPVNPCISDPLKVTIKTWPDHAAATQTFVYEPSHDIERYSFVQKLTIVQFFDTRGCELSITKP